MCNKGIADNSIDQQHHHQAVYLMDSHSSTTNSVSNSPPGLSSGSNDETLRVKFLCSFLGSILPRPQDGRLRYVGGETRIVSVPRDISFEELMNKMRELYEGVAVLKYQQPDEDLDALVSVVNDDDVINMMEEYDKLGSGDGFTRLRIFLFSHPDQDASSHYDGDERDTERRYVDALNNLNDGSDFRKQVLPDSPVMSPDDIHVAEQYFNSLSLEGSVHNQRNYEMTMPQYNLHPLAIPHVGSGQHHQPINQRFNEMEAPWSPAYYSPRHHGHDPRPVTEFPSSPSSARFHVVPFSELPDKCSDRMPEEYSRQPVNLQPAYEQQPQYSENVGWLPTGALSVEKSAFPGNLFTGPNVVEGSSICEHCRMSFHRNFDHPIMGNGLHPVSNPCAECPPNREKFMLNADAKLHHGIYTNEQNNEHRSLYNETQNHERGWILHQNLNARADEARNSVSGSVRMNDHYAVDGGVNLPLGHSSMVDGRHVSSNYLHHRAGNELGNEVFHDQTAAGASHMHVPPPEESGVRYGNMPFPFAGENVYSTHGHVSGHSIWRNVQNQAPVAQPFETCNSVPQVSGKINSGFPRGPWEGSPRFCFGMDNQNHWVESSKLLAFDGKAAPDYVYGQASRLNPVALGQENQHAFSLDPIQARPDMINLSSPMEPAIAAVMSDGIGMTEEQKEPTHVEKIENSDLQAISYPEAKKVGDNSCEVEAVESITSNCVKPADESSNAVKQGENNGSVHEDSELSVDRLTFLPELIASAKKAALEGVKDVKAKVEENTNTEKNELIVEEVASNELESANTREESEVGSDNDNIDTSRIEPTKAEAEAIAKGLQTIKNYDLEEIRELGSGTYGAVYHGKWKGSDVAIKRIKASCFAGRPSERERLIADFWKEALILSSLHHPNVVSFYGIVRDGPDGSLATVTEFMVNGSLKQFLQKKDRTIDRRKRLIIAMDAAFGMEYLHGKNIVHFDLKCENLLVNMRDPQRPVCKIGDLGLSKVKQHTLVSGGVRGTLPWMAPELLSGKSNMVTEKIDVYSFGIVMWELLTGEEPYADMHCASIIGGIVNNTLRPQIPAWCDPEWKALMESCWSSDPAQRPSFAEISQKLRNMAAAMNVK
ncbi:Mitogen-activated protein kinase kinase kinase [Parasponia andersonii]|uniref:Mitogen-activated protein kinase kinase kinase n=1 Tax=Parasponia andersonii TaxID=3476 RepID=A0A2P5C4N8_PARAD|nr:Mitogen-activated protein kinase kinase kinase [Parasponia andersonii]